MIETSVIIRTKNEEKWIGEVLKMLQKQTYQNFEIIIVDSGSNDRTLEIAKKFPVRVIQISQDEFSYPYALNVGCRAATAEKYFVFLSAHSLPISEKFLEEGIKSFTGDEIIGVYGPMRALSDGSIWEKMYFNFLCPLLELFTPEKMIIKKERMGVLGFTHAIIRRDLWEKYNFNEEFGLGGEDQDWVRHWTSKGLVVVKDKKFKVQHSHGLNLISFIRQWRNWYSVRKPQPFKKIAYRNWKW